MTEKEKLNKMKTFGLLGRNISYSFSSGYFKEKFEALNLQYHVYQNFDIDNIEQISTKGLSMFMTLPCKGEALANFNMMHNAAKKIGEEFGGQLLDSNRSALTVQTVRHYVEKIREFERKRLING